MYEDIVIEALKMYGQEVLYLPREWQKYDNIFADDPVGSFNKAYELVMYIENTEGFDGEGDLFTKFGIELRDQATFVLARREWTKSVSTDQTDISFYRPREGDLIYLKMSKSLFQVMKVQTESPFYQLSQLPVFKLQAELFEYSGEEFDTQYGDLNQTIETTSDYQLDIVVAFDSGQEDIYNKGEIVETLLDSDSALYMRGEVLNWDASTNTLTLIHVGKTDGKFGLFAVGNEVEGTSSGTLSTIVSINEIVDGNRDIAQNDVFSDSAEVSFIDFSEVNPFGDP